MVAPSGIAAEDRLERLRVDVEHGGRAGRGAGRRGRPLRVSAPAVPPTMTSRPPPAIQPAQGVELGRRERGRVDVLPHQPVERGPGLDALREVGRGQGGDGRRRARGAGQELELADDLGGVLGHDADDELRLIVERDGDQRLGDDLLAVDELDLDVAAEAGRLGVQDVGLARPGRELHRGAEVGLRVGAAADPELARDGRPGVLEVDRDREPARPGGRGPGAAPGPSWSGRRRRPRAPVRPAPAAARPATASASSAARGPGEDAGQRHAGSSISGGRTVGAMTPVRRQKLHRSPPTSLPAVWPSARAYRTMQPPRDPSGVAPCVARPPIRQPSQRSPCPTSDRSAPSASTPRRSGTRAGRGAAVRRHRRRTSTGRCSRATRATASASTCPRREPGEDPDERYRRAARTLTAWRSDGTLRKDPRPSVYVYEQAYRVPGHGPRADPARVLRPAAHRAVRADSRVLPHERTLSGPKEDRYRLLRATGLNTLARGRPVRGPGGEAAAALAGIAAGHARDRRHGRRRRPPSAVGRRRRGRGLAGPGDARRARAAARSSSPTAITATRPRSATATSGGRPRPRQDPAFDFLLMLFLDADEPLTVLPTHRVRARARRRRRRDAGRAAARAVLGHARSTPTRWSRGSRPPAGCRAARAGSGCSRARARTRSRRSGARSRRCRRWRGGRRPRAGRLAARGRAGAARRASTPTPSPRGGLGYTKSAAEAARSCASAGTAPMPRSCSSPRRSRRSWPSPARGT